MKFKSLFTGLVMTVIALLIVSCNENLDQIGFSVQPGKDRLSVDIDTLNLQARTVKADSVFTRTRYPVLGEYIDPVFGSVKSEYMGEFYFPEDTEFKKGAVIDSVRTIISYSSIMGDSLSPMELSVYEINKSLKKAENYTNVDPSEYADLSAPLGKQIFSGKNAIYYVAQRTEKNAYQQTVVIPYNVYQVPVTLPNAVGERFLSEYNKEGHGKLTDADSFREFFPGLYFTTTFGNGTMVNVSRTSLHIYYHYNDVGGSSTGKDTIRTNAINLYITPEVIQVTHVLSNDDGLLGENEAHTFLKTPSGIYTEIKLPLSKIHDKLRTQALNLASLNIFALPDPTENEMVKIAPPEYLLLINKDSLDGFFEQRKLSDQLTCFVSSRFDATTYSYKFSNISSMINYYNEKSEGKPFDLTYCLIPVDAVFTEKQGGYGYAPQSELTALYNRMWPSAAILDKKEGNLKLGLIFSNF